MAFRGFGAAPASGGFGFGAAAQPAAGFGATQPSTGFGFGAAAQPSAASSPFGAPATPASPFGGGANTTPAFGASSGFGSSTTSAFGAPAAGTTTSAFGNTSGGTSVGFGGFGNTANSTPAFGAAATPAASPFGPSPTTASPFGGGGGGMFGSNTAAKPAFGAGGFGSTTTTSTFGAATPSAFGAAPTTSTFGATAPSTGFGGTSAFGAPATSGFGATPNAFGTPAATPSAFGAPAASPFGATPATTSAFGAAPTSAFGGFSQQQQPQQAGAQCGTGNPPYAPTAEQETEKNKPATTIHYQSISKMPQYQHKSVEELRWEDYLKRTDPAAAQQQAALVPNTGGATTTTGFGAFGAANTTTSAFGAKPPLGGGFGSTPTTGFGATTGAFGSTTPSAFGAQPAAPTSAFGGFGSTPAQPAASAFGTSPGGMFGSSTTTSAFGQPAAQTPSAFGGFGSTATPSTPAFGSAGTSAFGAPAAPSAFSGFGSTPAQPAATSGFGAAPSTFSFNKPAAPTTGGFGGFGSTTTPAPSGGMFGSTATATPSTSAFGTSAFGTNKPATGGFGGFGSTTTTTPATPGFGTAGTGSSLFSTPTTTPSTGFNFSATPSTTPTTTGGFGSSLFGKPATPSTTNAFSLTTPSTTPSLFGSTAAPATTGSAFSFPAPGATTGGFGQAAPPAPTTLVAGHDANPYGAGSFGAGLIEQQIKTTLTLPVPHALPRAKVADAVEYQRPSALARPVATVPTFLSVPKTTVAAPTPARRLLDETPMAPSAADFSFATTKFKSIATKQLNIDTPPKVRRVPPPSAPHVIPAEDPAAPTVTLAVTLPSKTTLQIVVDSLATGADVRAAITEKAGLAGAFEVRFDGAPVTAAHKAVEFVNGSLDVVAAQPFMSFDAFFEANGNKADEFASPAQNPLAPTLTKEGYYTLPDIATLSTMSTAELQAVDNFAVGCKGLGCVQWYGATDVTNLQLDDLVLFSTREVVVYPDEDNKHALGSGLNRPALVELLQVYPPTQPAKRQQYIDRVRTRTETMDATFVDYCPDAGVWKFRVEHFSRYGLDEDDDDDADHSMSAKKGSLQAMASTLQLNPHRLHELSAMYLPPDAAPAHEAPASTLSVTRLAVVEPTPTPATVPVPRSLVVYPIKTPATSRVFALWNGPLKSLDMGIFLGKSFRASFGPGGVLTTSHAGQHVAMRPHSPPLPSTSLLAAHRAVSRQDPVTRHVTLPADVSALLDGFSNGPDALLWSLVQALYGQESATAPYLPPIATTAPALADLPAWDRRHAFVSQWFARAVQRPAPKTPSVSAVLHHLCQYRLMDAATMAATLGNFRLATLIAQAASYRDGDFRASLRVQLEAWAETNALQFMEPELAWAYSLLAGSVTVVTQRLPQLDWLQALALVFWYQEGPQSLATAVRTFQAAVAAQLCKAPRHGLKADALMELLLVAVGAKASLVPLLSVLDAEAAWHLHAVLSHLPGQSLRLTSKQASLLTTNYISALADAGRVADAVYVGLTIADDVERRATVVALLHRAAATDGLLQTLAPLVPAVWFHDAMAVIATAVRDFAGAVDHYMQAGDFDAAHRTLLLHVAVPSLFRGETRAVAQALAAIEPHHANVPLWARFGAVVLSYLRLREAPHIATRHVVLSVCAKLKEWQLHPLAHLGVGADALLERAVVANMLTYMTQTAVALEQAMGDEASAVWLERLQGFVQADCFGEAFRATSLVHVCASLVE
ncbi:nuclear pore complex protein [Achlya hypogyna]|uniref:Nuclear pore complex protein n=1 Tax=Achlya hypogyna TaxID=1202772 RepID=A0A1V9Z025_ACHHY|nr:nuclear pore complex protein [Achlya hypogyna]